VASCDHKTFLKAGLSYLILQRAQCLFLRTLREQNGASGTLGLCTLRSQIVYRLNDRKISGLPAPYGNRNGGRNAPASVLSHHHIPIIPEDIAQPLSH